MMTMPPMHKVLTIEQGEVANATDGEGGYGSESS